MSDVSVKQRLTVVFGEENAAHILALMAQVGEEGEQIVMLLIAEIVRRDEQVQGMMRPLNTCAASSLDKSESGMKIRIRGSYRRGIFQYGTTVQFSCTSVSVTPAYATHSTGPSPRSEK